MLYRAVMNLGKRIETRLIELGWERRDLLERVPDLTPQSLSALVRRDSKRSEWDYEIACALGVTLHWLNDGIGPKLLDAPPEQSVTAGLDPISEQARHLIRRLEQAERAGTSSPLLLAALEKVMDLGLPRKTAAPLAAETADFAGKPRRIAQADPAIDGATPRRKR